MLSVIAGLEKPYRGKVIVAGKPLKAYHGNTLYRGNLALLPQNPQTVFLRDTVRADFFEILGQLEIPSADRDRKISDISARIGIESLLDRHPYDLSGGEQQKCAIAKLLLLEPRRCCSTRQRGSCGRKSMCCPVFSIRFLSTE